MIINDYPLVAIISMGHTGSRLLSQILQANGIFMGRRTCVPGEDSKFGITNDAEFEQSALTYALGLDRNRLPDLLIKRLKDFENDIFNKPATTYLLKNRLKNVVFGKSEYIYSRPSNTWAYVIKNAIASSMYADALLQVEKKYKKIYFIHLTRNLNDYLKSGIAKGTRGIPRPIYLDYANNFLNDYNKYLWFGSTDPIVNLSGKSIELRKLSAIELEKNRMLLESELWAQCNYRAISLKNKDALYLQIKFEDLLQDSSKVSKQLSNFFDRDIKIKKGNIDTSRFSEIIMPEGCSEFAYEVQTKLGYNI